MKITRSSWIFKVAYFPERVFKEEWNIPDRTNVCTLFARLVFQPPAFAFFCCIAGPILAGTWVYEKLSGMSFLSTPIRLPAAVELVSRRVRDWKEGVCTIVEIEE